jgi:pimeloyl-ACP methyl ester carboxylesterase
MSRSVRHPGLHDSRGRDLPHGQVDVMGIPTYVVDAGEGPPVVLIHGYGDTADGWRRVVPGLLEKHRVVALDVPPFGRSGDPKAKKLIDLYKEFFPAFFDELGIDSATLIGHSIGGAISLHFALDNPERIDRLGLVAPAGLGKSPPWWWHLLAGYGPAWRAALSLPSPVTPVLIRGGMKRFLDWRLFHDPRKLEQDVRHLLDMHCSPKEFDRLLEAGRCCIDSYTGTLLEDSARIEVPLFMVWGRRDGLVPSEHARSFGQVHPTAEVHVFENCGHYPQIELPSRFNRLLRRWMSDTQPAPKLRTARAVA